MTIGSNLKKCRTAQGLTQEDLARRLHVTRQTVSSWERNNSHPDSDQLAAIAAALGWRLSLTRRQRRGCVVAGTVLVGVLAVLPPSIQLVGQAYGTAPAWLSQLAGWLLLATYKGWLSCTLALLGGVCWGLFLSGERERA